MKSFIFATITGFALTLTLWTQLPNRQPAQEEAVDAPLQTVIPQGSVPATPVAPAQPATASGTATTAAGAAATAATPAVPATTPAAPVAATTPAAPTPQTLTPRADTVLSMADVEKAYAIYYASRLQASQELAARDAELEQYNQMRARLSPQDQYNPAHPVYQAISALQARIRQIQGLVSANAQLAFFEVATGVAAIRVGLSVESLKRAQELLMFIARDSFSTDWSQGVYTQQASATQPDFMLNQTPATTVSAPVAAPATQVSIPSIPAPAQFGPTTTAI